MQTQVLNQKVQSGVGVAVGLALVWLIAAALRPTSTFHLAPILVAGAAPVLARGSADVPKRALVIATLIGAAVAAVAALLLAAFDLLRGPTLLPYGGAFAEAITFILLGAVAGLAVGLLRGSTDR